MFAFCLLNLFNVLRFAAERVKRMALTLKPYASLRTGFAGPGRVFQYDVLGGEQ
jgi:hypothetical protein